MQADTTTGAGESVAPAIDIEGSWVADASRPLQCFRADTSVECILINGGFAHRLVGSYVAPNVVQLDVTRRNRGNGCTTFMTEYAVLLSSNSMQLTWVARDSNCDLTAGQSGTDPLYTRIF